MHRVAVDWDGTLVDARSQEWLPGAQNALRQLKARGYEVFIHTCHANWPEGVAAVEAKLAQAGLDLEIVAKPSADFYIDDRARRFDGNWKLTLALVPPTQKALREMERMVTR